MDERRLRDELESLERAAPDVPPPPGPASARRRSSLLWVPAALAMVAGVFIGLWVADLLPRGSSRQVAVSPAASQPMIGLRWTAVPFDESAVVQALSTVGSRVFATGRDDKGPAAWYSDDGGESWMRSDARLSDVDSIASTDLSLGPVVAFHDALISLGTMPAGSSGNDADVKGAIWRSANDGATWELSTGGAPPVTTDIAARDDVLVAVGRPSHADGAQIWTSVDGLHWQQASADQLEHAVLAGVAATADRILVVGTRQNDDTTTSAMTWESTDGIAWQATAVATPGRFGDVAVGPPGLAVGGDLGQGDATTDHSVMLVAQQFDLNQVHGGSPTSVTAIASGPMGVVLSARNVPHQLESSTWFLPGGRAADAIETDPQMPGLDDVVALSDRFIGLGHCPPIADCYAASFLAVGQPQPVAVATGRPAPTVGSTLVPLPTVADFNGGCRGVGLLDVSLRGDAADPRVAWLVQPDGTRFEVIWPPGLVARFSPDLEIIDASGSVILQAGDRVSDACKIERDDGSFVLLIAPGS